MWTTSCIGCCVHPAQGSRKFAFEILLSANRRTSRINSRTWASRRTKARGKCGSNNQLDDLFDDEFKSVVELRALEQEKEMIDFGRRRTRVMRDCTQLLQTRLDVLAAYEFWHPTIINHSEPNIRWWWWWVLYWQYLYKQSRTMRYVHTQVGDEKAKRNDVEHVHLKLSALGIVVTSPV